MSNVVPKDLYDDLQAELVKKSEQLGELRMQLQQKDELLKKIGVVTFLRSRVEIYETLLSSFGRNARLRSVNSDPPNLDTLGLDFSDQTVKQSFYLHYNRWMNILRHSLDARMPSLRNVITQAGFQTDDAFSRYVAVLFVHLSNVLHNMPPDVINWENEDEVVTYLQSWHIRDVQELNACRVLYRLPTIQ